MFTAVDCQGFAGGFTLGVKQAGFTLVGKVENVGGFGVPAVTSNSALLGEFPVQVGEPSSWIPTPADLVFGNPPCSGFSLLTYRGKKGERETWQDGRWDFEKSQINNCMDDLVNYGVACGAKIIILESVQNAYTKGLEKFQGMRPEGYELTHVLHNNRYCGGYAERRRYFAVYHQVPFSVPSPTSGDVTLWDAIGDLEEVALGALEGHVTLSQSEYYRQAYERLLPYWPAGTSVHNASVELEKNEPCFYATLRPGFMRDKGGFGPARWRYDKPAHVVTGGTPGKVFHPSLDRLLTHREIARILGFPDNWLTDAYRAKKSNACWWGKGIPVASGRWVAQGAEASLRGERLDIIGTQVGDHEHVINLTHGLRSRVKEAR